jgi:hypothetical protein
VRNKYTWIAVLGVVACHRPAIAAEQYWAYDYKHISVTAQGSSDFARTLAHNLYRLDLSMTAVLQNTASAGPLPTAVYAVPEDLFTAFSGLAKDNGSVGQTNPYSTTLLINTSQSGDNRYWSAYYAFGSGMLATAYSFRYPPWFISGLCEVFAASSVDFKGVTIGGANPGRVSTLLRGTWIPLQILISVRGNDPQMSSKDFEQMYYAESWYLVHKIVIDQFYHTNFYEYFKRLDRGEDEAKAFSGAFTSTYEEMDKALKKSVTNDKFMRLKVSIKDDDDGSKPVQLTEAKAKGRLALYAAEHGVQPELALTLAAAALKIEPGLADAQEARVRAELRSKDRESALRDAGNMCGATTTSSSMATTCAFAFSSLAHSEPVNSSSTASKAELFAKARLYYELSVQLQPEDMRSWYGLSQLASDTRDVALASELLPKLVSRQAAHPHLGSLAGSIAGLYSMTGDSASAMKYALLWHANAISGSERAAASAYISRLKGENDRKQAAGGEGGPN